MQFLFCLESGALGVVVADSEVGTNLDHVCMTALLAVVIGAVCYTALDVVDSFTAASAAAVISVRHVLHLTLFLIAELSARLLLSKML